MKKYLNLRTIHIISWICYLVLQTVFLNSLLSFEVALYRSSQLVILHAALFYFNSMFLMPRLLEKRKYVLYISSLFGILMITVVALYLINNYIKPFGDTMMTGRNFRLDIDRSILRNPGAKGTDGTIFITRSFMRYFSSNAAVILLSIVYRLVYREVVEEKRQVNLRNEHLLSEMNFLKSQVNPHFLFNALNNVYTLVHLKHDQAPAMLMKLSNMLRYMLYECNDEWVPVKKEINYINNYIELQQLKTEETQNIAISVDGLDYSVLIPPLLLIPFIENSFKHSGVEKVGNGWVRIDLKFSKQNIYFKIANSIPKIATAKDQIGGIGLENVRRRLELIFPNKFELNIEEDQQQYTVTLNIDTNDL